MAGNRKDTVPHKTHPNLPYLVLLHPILQLGLLRLVVPPENRWQYRDVGGAFLIFFEAIFVLLVLALLKIAWIPLWLKVTGLSCLLLGSAVLFLNALSQTPLDRIALTYLSGWAALACIALFLLSAVSLRP